MRGECHLQKNTKLQTDWKHPIQPVEQGEGMLSRFYVRSGVRENCFCEKNPKYQLPKLVSSEARERAGLRGASYR